MTRKLVITKKRALKHFCSFPASFWKKIQSWPRMSMTGSYWQRSMLLLNMTTGKRGYYLETDPDPIAMVIKSRPECTTFAPATIAPVINANVKRNPNPNPNPKPNLHPYPTPNQKPNHYPHSNSLLSEISSPEQLLPEQMSDHQESSYPSTSPADRRHL